MDFLKKLFRNSKITQSQQNNGLSKSIMYGVINGIMVIPVSISFCAIIFRHEAFESHLPLLVKLVLFSSTVHQLAFSTWSSLPFAVGQVQDAGLIFLSAIASDIASDPHTGLQRIVPTTLFALCICTTALGFMLIIVSRLKLASLIQYIPMPVIGGYLAYIGFFCGEAGLAMMAGVQVSNLLEWSRFFQKAQTVLLALPGLCMGITIYLLLHKFRSPYVLPICLFGILIAFYLFLGLSGASLQQARDFGWISPLAPQVNFYEAWMLYDASEVDWSRLPNQVLRLIGMFLVVAFSSSLDVAAIEMELGLPLDYNRELQTVGLSNFISGATGGYTGSYIFSQTIFNMRREINSRVCGYIIALCELLMIFIPVSITSYIPKMFFGSLLILISVDLMFEWLVSARNKMAFFEYVVCLTTFISIQFTGIEIGMFIGILFAMASFIISYSKMQTVSSAALRSSSVIRTYEERAVLIANRAKVVTISLNGYIFFGSAVKVLEEVKSRVVISLAPAERLPMSESSSISSLQPQLRSFHSSEDNGMFSSSLMPDSTAALSQSRSDQQNPLFLGEKPKSKVRTKPAAQEQLVFSYCLTPKLNKRVELADKRKQPNKNNSNSPSKPIALADPNQIGYGSISNRVSPVASSRPTSHPNNEGVGYPEDSLTVDENTRLLNPNPQLHAPTGSVPSDIVGYDLDSKKSSPTYSNVFSVYDLPEDQILSRHGIWKKETQGLPVSVGSYGNKSSKQKPSNADTGNSNNPQRKEISSLQSQAAHRPTSLLSQELNASNNHRHNDVEMRLLDTAAEDSSLEKRPEKALQDTQAQSFGAGQSFGSWVVGGDLSEITGSNVGGSQQAQSSSISSFFLSSTGRIDTKNDHSQSHLHTNEEIFSSNPGPWHQTQQPHPPSVSSGLVIPASKSRSGSIKHSNSLLALVWDNQAQRKGMLRLRSYSDLALDRAIGDAATGVSEQDHRLSLDAEEKYHIPGSPRRSEEDASGSAPHSPQPHDLLLPLDSASRIQSTFSFAQNDAKPMLEEEIRTEYLVLDFTNVLGVDATAARSCFLMLVQLMRAAHVVIVFASLSTNVESLLRAHNVIGADDVVIPQLDDALEWCEEQVLLKAESYFERLSHQKVSLNHERPETRLRGGSAEVSSPFSSSKGLSRDPDYYTHMWRQRQEQAIQSPRLAGKPVNPSNDDIEAQISQVSRSQVPPQPPSTQSIRSAKALKRILEDYLEVDSSQNQVIRALLSSELLSQYFDRSVCGSWEIVFDIDDPADKIFFIEKGNVELVTISPFETPGAPEEPNHATPSKGPSQAKTEAQVSLPRVNRVNKVSSGGAFGESDFFLGRNHSVRAYTISQCVFWSLTRESYSRMEVEHPRLCMLIQHSLLKSLAIASTWSMFALHPTTALKAGVYA